MGFSELWNLIFFLLEGERMGEDERGWERMEEEKEEGERMEEEDCQLYAYGAEHVVGGKRLLR